MQANQLLEDLARAVEAAKTAQEYCFLGFQHWFMCMTKAEWSGWMQAVGSVAAIAITAFIATRENRIRRGKDKESEIILKKQMIYILRKTDFLNKLEFYRYQWKTYEKITRMKSMLGRTEEFPGTSFFIYTRRSFFLLSDAVRQMSAENNEFILTGKYSFEFGNLCELILFYEGFYSAFVLAFDKFLPSYGEEAMLLDIENIDAWDIKMLEYKLEPYHDRIFMHKKELFDLSHELFKKLDYVAR